MVSATTSPPCAWRSAVAAPSARTSNELTSPGTPSRTSRRVSGSKRSAERTGTYLTQTTVRMGLRLSPHLARIENAARVEDVLDRPHQLQGLPVLAGGVEAVAESHAVLTRARPPEAEGRLDERVAHRRRSPLLRLDGPDEDVDDADPRVSEEVGLEASGGRDRLRAADELRERADRDRHVGAHRRRAR